MKNHCYERLKPDELSGETVNLHKKKYVQLQKLIHPIVLLWRRQRRVANG